MQRNGCTFRTAPSKMFQMCEWFAAQGALGIVTVYFRPQTAPRPHGRAQIRGWQLPRMLTLVPMAVTGVACTERNIPCCLRSYRSTEWAAWVGTQRWVRRGGYTGPGTWGWVRGGGYVGVGTRGRVRRGGYAGVGTHGRLRRGGYVGAGTRGRVRGGEYTAVGTRGQVRGGGYAAAGTWGRVRRGWYAGVSTLGRVCGGRYAWAATQGRLCGGGYGGAGMRGRVRRGGYRVNQICLNFVFNLFFEQFQTSRNAFGGPNPWSLIRGGRGNRLKEPPSLELQWTAGPAHCRFRGGFVRCRTSTSRISKRSFSFRR